MVSAALPYVFSSRTRTRSPATVDRAMSRTVAFVIVASSGDSPCRDEPHEATHCCAPAFGAKPTASTTWTIAPTSRYALPRVSLLSMPALPPFREP